MCFDRNINENRNVKFFEWEEEESHFSKVTDVFSRPENLLSIAVGGGSGP